MALWPVPAGWKFEWTKERRETAEEEWEKAVAWFGKSKAAYTLYRILDKEVKQNFAIAVMEKPGKGGEEASIFRPKSKDYIYQGKLSKKSVKCTNGTVFWSVMEKTLVARGKRTGEQSTYVSLIHEMYHAWQSIFDKKAFNSVSGKLDAGSKLWIKKQVRIEQVCCHFESIVAGEIGGEAIRDDYMHYKCTAGTCGVRGVAPNLEKKYYCDEKDFVPTIDLVYEYAPAWDKNPFKVP